MNITTIAFPDVSTVVITLADGTVTTYVIPVGNPTPNPVTVTEVDVKTSDGSTEIFTPEVIPEVTPVA